VTKISEVVREVTIGAVHVTGLDVVELRDPPSSFHLYMTDGLLPSLAVTVAAIVLEAPLTTVSGIASTSTSNEGIGPTSRVNEALSFVPPSAVPVIVSVYLSGGALLKVLTVRMEVKSSLPLSVLKEKVPTLPGKPDKLKDTCSGWPLLKVTLTEYVVISPVVTVRTEGEGTIRKLTGSGFTMRTT
jgi:hypothetical protein